MIISFRKNGAAKLAASLDVQFYSLRAAKMRGNGYLNRAAEHKLTHLINWGCAGAGLRQFPEYKQWKEAGLVINDNNEAARKKLKFFALLDEAGIQHPTVTTNLEEAVAWDHPYFARIDGSYGGKGMQFVEAKTAPLPTKHALRYDFYSRLLDYRREMRFHVWNGEIILQQLKVDAEQEEGAEPVLIHNRAHGVTFKKSELITWLGPETTKKAQEMAIAATKAANMDFGAIDLMQTQDRELYVLEINSQPGLKADSTRVAYRNKFAEYLICDNGKGI